MSNHDICRVTLGDAERSRKMSMGEEGAQHNTSCSHSHLRATGPGLRRPTDGRKPSWPGPSSADRFGCAVLCWLVHSLLLVSLGSFRLDPDKSHQVRVTVVGPTGPCLHVIFFFEFVTIASSFVCDTYCPIIY